MLSRQVELLSPLETHSWIWQGLVFKRVKSCHFFVIILWGVRMPCQPFLIEGYDYLWALDIGFLGRDQVSLIRVHFIRNMSSPLESVSPVIHSGFKPQAKPCGFSDFFFFLLWFALLPLFFRIRISFVLTSLWFFQSCVLFSVTAETQQWGQGNPGSLLVPNVVSSSENPFRFRRYSSLPFTTWWFRTFSNTYSSSSSSTSSTFFLFCFLPHSARQLSGIKDDAARVLQSSTLPTLVQASRLSCPSSSKFIMFPPQPNPPAIHPTGVALSWSTQAEKRPSFSQQSWFQLLTLPVCHFAWCTLHIS